MERASQPVSSNFQKGAKQATIRQTTFAFLMGVLFAFLKGFLFAFLKGVLFDFLKGTKIWGAIRDTSGRPLFHFPGAQGPSDPKSLPF